ncbi:MAG: FISUMP domain-containing protein [Candidatus Falkowbacteria bacterium]
MKKNKTAFTLIELLVVIAIIGILATISVIALANARAKSRDAKRAGDMKQVQTALELFFNDNNRYPTAEEWATGKIYSTSTDTTSTYMQIIPTATVPSDGNCTNDQNATYYNPSIDGSTYTISFCLGNTTGTLTPGPKCLTPGGIVDADCGRVGDSLSCPGLPVVQYEGGLYDANGISTTTGGYYRTVFINGKCWLRDNLNIGTQICSTGTGCALAPSIDNSPEKYCFENNLSYCNTDGGIYTWPESMGLPNHCNWGIYNCTAGTCTHPTYADCNYPDTVTTPRKGFCPPGWHLPNDSELHALDVLATNSGATCSASIYAPDCAGAGTRLLSKSVGGLDEFGFNMILGGTWGIYDSRVVLHNVQGGLWSSTAAPAPYGNHAIVRYFGLGDATVYRDWNGRAYGYSVRCAKD